LDLTFAEKKHQVCFSPAAFIFQKGVRLFEPGKIHLRTVFIKKTGKKNKRLDERRREIPQVQIATQSFAAQTKSHAN
jgi:hypothetical protein